MSLFWGKGDTETQCERGLHSPITSTQTYILIIVLQAVIVPGNSARNPGSWTAQAPVVSRVISRGLFTNYFLFTARGKWGQEITRDELENECHVIHLTFPPLNPILTFQKEEYYDVISAFGKSGSRCDHIFFSEWEGALTSSRGDEGLQ